MCEMKLGHVKKHPTDKRVQLTCRRGTKRRQGATLPAHLHSLHHPAALQLRPVPDLAAIHPLTLVVLLLDPQAGQFARHDPAGLGARDPRIRREVRDPLVAAQKVLVQQSLAVDVGRRGFQDGEDGVREDGGLAQLRQVRFGLVAGVLRRSGFDGLY